MPIKTITSLVDTYWVDSTNDVNSNFNLLKEGIDDIGVGGFTAGTGDNKTTIEPDGSLVLEGSATVWSDIDFPIIIRTTGPNIPVLSTIIGNLTAPQWIVNDYNMCEGQELIHGWKEGSAFYWHIHVVTNGLDVDNRFLKFEVEWVWADVDETLSEVQVTTSGELLIPANTTSKTHLSLTIGSSTIPAHIAGHIWARLKRVASSGAAPTLNPWCSMLQLHIESDMIGSRSVGSK